MNTGEIELVRSIAGLSSALAALLWAATGMAAISSSGGLTAASADGEYTFRLGGRLMWDADSFDGVLNRANDGERRFNSQLRRARIELSGKLPGELDWVFDVNYFDDGDAEIHAAGLRFSGWDLADVFIGRDKEPFGLEELTSSKAISTMRRNFLTEATDADSQPHYGVRFDGKAGPLGWSAGIFNPNGNPTDEDGGDRLAFTGRLFGAPLNDNGRVLHFGAAFTDRNLDEPQLEQGFRLRVAESGDRLPSAAVIARADRQAGFEALYLDGPLSLQGEYFLRDLPGAGNQPDGEVHSHYVQATWTLTGESRGYKAASGVPGMITPAGGRGAIELVAKAERIGFDVDGSRERKARAYTAGANWYPNRNIKVMLNLSHVDTTALAAAAEDDDGLAVSARLQVAF